jgi:hypothetical protein
MNITAPDGPNVIYGLFDPISKCLHYIGYTSNQERRYEAHCQNKEGTKQKCIWIGGLKKQRLKPVMEVIEEYATTSELPDAEEFWYGYFKLIGAELYNDPHYIGKGGGKGRKHTEETRQKLSKAAKGRPKSEEHKRKIGEGNKGKSVSGETRKKISKISKIRKGKSNGPLSEETRQKIAETKKGNRNPNFGKTPSEETRRKMSIASTGRKHSDETKQKIAISNARRPVSPETRQKLSIANTGKIVSQEARQKMSIAGRGRPKSEEHKKKIGKARMKFSPEIEMEIYREYMAGNITMKELATKYSATKSTIFRAIKRCKEQLFPQE